MVIPKMYKTLRNGISHTFRRRIHPATLWNFTGLSSYWMYNLILWSIATMPTNVAWKIYTPLIYGPVVFVPLSWVIIGQAF